MMTEVNELNWKRVIVVLVSLVCLLGGVELIWQKTGSLHFATSLVLGVTALLWVMFWLSQFIDLMRRSDDEFVGRFDKLIWAAVFILLFPLAPVAYWIWKPDCWQMEPRKASA